MQIIQSITVKSIFAAVLALTAPKIAEAWELCSDGSYGNRDNIVGNWAVNDKGTVWQFQSDGDILCRHASGNACNYPDDLGDPINWAMAGTSQVKIFFDSGKSHHDFCKQYNDGKIMEIGLLSFRRTSGFPAKKARPKWRAPSYVLSQPSYNHEEALRSLPIIVKTYNCPYAQVEVVIKYQGYDEGWYITRVRGGYSAMWLTALGAFTTNPNVAFMAWEYAPQGGKRVWAGDHRHGELRMREAKMKRFNGGSHLISGIGHKEAYALELECSN